MVIDQRRDVRPCELGPSPAYLSPCGIDQELMSVLETEAPAPVADDMARLLGLVDRMHTQLAETIAEQFGERFSRVHGQVLSLVILMQKLLGQGYTRGLVGRLALLGSDLHVSPSALMHSALGLVLRQESEPLGQETDGVAEACAWAWVAAE